VLRAIRQVELEPVEVPPAVPELNRRDSAEAQRAWPAVGNDFQLSRAERTTQLKCQIGLAARHRVDRERAHRKHGRLADGLPKCRQGWRCLANLLEHSIAEAGILDCLLYQIINEGSYVRHAHNVDSVVQAEAESGDSGCARFKGMSDPDRGPPCSSGTQESADAEAEYGDKRKESAPKPKTSFAVHRSSPSPSVGLEARDFPLPRR